MGLGFGSPALPWLGLARMTFCPSVWLTVGANLPANAGSVSLATCTGESGALVRQVPSVSI